MNKDYTLTDERLEAAAAFHGHLCGGLLIGCRAALYGMKLLEVSRSKDEELIAIVENSSCSTDGIQFFTGCTFGKGNLIFRDWGKQVVTLAHRSDGQAVRLSFIGDRLKSKKPDGTPDKAGFKQIMRTAPDEDLFTFERITADLPPLAEVYPSIPCDDCGEVVMEPRLFDLDGQRLCPACLLKLNPAVMLDRVAHFVFETGMLKKTPRTGYQFLGNGFETVAAHSFRTAVIGYILARLTPGVDPEKVLKLALFHDLAEARTGDHNYVNKQYVTVDEHRAAHDSAANVPCGREIEALTREFVAGETREAMLAYDADQLDMAAELKEKKDLGNPYASAWLFYAEKRLKTDVGRGLFRTILDTDWTAWWFDKKEHLWVRNG